MPKSYNWNPSTCIYENGKYLKSISDTLVIVCNETMNSIDSVSRNVTNTVTANVTSTVSINSDDKNLRHKMDCPVLHKVLLLVILRFIITAVSYHYGKRKVKIKAHCCNSNIKIENNELKKSNIKDCACYNFDDIIKTEDSDFDNFLLDKK